MTAGARRVEVRPDAATLVRDAADEVARRFRESVEATGSFVLVLAGGGTPRALHAEIVARYADLPWKRAHILFGDERCVSPADPESNYRMAKETLLARVRVRDDAVHRMPGEAADADAAARAYEETLRRVLRDTAREGPDLVLLGMGGDGHTASLFPGSPALRETERLVVPADAPPGVSPPRRLTLTFPAIAAAARVLFLVTGKGKRDALAAALAPDDPPPAGRVTAKGEVVWYVDEAAHGSPL